MRNDDQIIKNTLKNSVFVILSQGLFLLLSFFTSFLIPRFLGVTEFGYWQIYLFYTSYVGFFHFGFNDGVYLRYGHLDYDQLPQKLLRSTIRIYMMSLVIISGLLYIFALFESNADKQFALSMTAINIFVVSLTGLFIYIFQFTNQIRRYSFITILNRIIFVIFLMFLFYFQMKNYKLVVILDLSTRIIVLIVCTFFSKELLYGEIEKYNYGLKEYLINIKVGINLMLASIMGMLISGIGRFLIERFMSIEDFGLYSFANTATNLALVFINAISLVLYPALKRMESKDIAKYYLKINIILCIVIYFCLFLYFPICLIVEVYLSAYIPILEYLFILFPVVIANAKLVIVINTYYKALREEKAMFKANISSVIMFIVLVLPVFYFYKSVKLIAIGTLITMLWRCYLSELYLKKKMNIVSHKNIIQEILLIISFLVFTSFQNLFVGFIGYSFSFLLYTIVNYKEIKFYIKKTVKMFTRDK